MGSRSRLRSCESKSGSRGARMVLRRNPQFSQCLNSTFTVHKNNQFHPYLRNRINCAAIVGL